jgi:FAD/FMN-containing dehydrogenase
MDDLMRQLCPDFEVVWYGHIGDGNLHLNLLKPAHMELSQFEARAHEISEKTYAVTQQAGGSISAEHGIGLLKQPWLDRSRSKAEIEYLASIKKAFDPAGILNPGKLLPTGNNRG